MSNKLPPGWEWVPVGELCDVKLGQSPPGSSYNKTGEGTPFLQGKAEFGVTYPTVRKWTTEPKKYSDHNSVLVSVRAPVGPTNLAPTDCAIGRGLAALRPRGNVASEFVLWAMRASEARLAERATGTTFGAITGSQLKEHCLPVAPLAEQERIVAAIESHFSCLDAVDTLLEAASRRCQLLVKSILAEAFPNDLPPGWDWVPVGELGIEVRGQVVPKPETTYDLYSVPAFSTGCPEIAHGTAIRSGKRPVQESDVLLCKINPRINRVWSVGCARGRLQIASTEYFVLRLHEPRMTHYVRHYFSSPMFRAWIELAVEGATGSHTRAKSGPILEQFVPVPPVAEQKRIVSHIEESFARVDTAAEKVESVVAKIAAMRRSILTQAFTGQLVP